MDDWTWKGESEHHKERYRQPGSQVELLDRAVSQLLQHKDAELNQEETWPLNKHPVPTRQETETGTIEDLKIQNQPRYSPQEYDRTNQSPVVQGYVINREDNRPYLSDGHSNMRRDLPYHEQNQSQSKDLARIQHLEGLLTELCMKQQKTPEPTH